MEEAVKEEVEGRIIEVRGVNTIKEKGLISIAFVVIETNMMHSHVESLGRESKKNTKKTKVKHYI